MPKNVLVSTAMLLLLQVRFPTWRIRLCTLQLHRPMQGKTPDIIISGLHALFAGVLSSWHYSQLHCLEHTNTILLKHRTTSTLRSNGHRFSKTITDTDTDTGKVLRTDIAGKGMTGRTENKMEWRVPTRHENHWERMRRWTGQWSRKVIGTGEPKVYNWNSQGKNKKKSLLLQP